MATPTTQLDRAAVETQARQILLQLLAELSSPRSHVDLSLSLDRDLGVGSLERVELLLRLEAAFGIQISDEVAAAADTPADLVNAILRASPEAEPARQLPQAPVRVQAGPVPPPLGVAAMPLENAETLSEVLARHARAHPAQPHIHLYEEGGPEAARPGDPQIITYGDLYQRAVGIARRLHERGIAPGDTVALMLPTSAEFFYAFFGALFAGAIPVPMYPPFRADRIGEYAARQAGILRNARVKLLITFRQAETAARLLKPHVRSLAAVVNVSRFAGATARPGEGPLVRGAAHDIAFLQYTSGSTGHPKGVILTHANLLANIRAIKEAVALTPEDVVVSWLPLYHDMGLIGTWLTPLYFGVPTVVFSPLAFLNRPQRWLWAIHRHRATLSPAPNFAYELCARKLSDAELHGLDLRCWRMALNGAEPVNPDTLDRFSDRLAPYGFRPQALTPVYGLAEATLAVAVPLVNRGPRIDTIQRGPFEESGRALLAGEGGAGVIRFVSAGHPLRGHEVRLVDSEGHEVPERQEGYLWFRGPSASQGYYRNPQATHAILRDDGWVDSGDRAYRADGELFITGRTKDIIIKAGRNLYPHEIEEIASRVEGVRKGCVVAFSFYDERVGTERLVVVAEMRGLPTPSERERIATAITEQVTEVVGVPPDRVELVLPHSVPKTPSGKLRRDESRRLYRAGKLGARRAPTWLQVIPLALTAAARTTGHAVVRALEALYGAYALSVFGILLVLTWVPVHVLPRRAAARLTRQATRLCLALAGYRIRIEGREHLESAVRSPHCVVVNHTSYMDVLITLAGFPFDFRYVAKLEVRSMPFISGYVRRLGYFAFDRSDAQARLRQVEEMEEHLRQGQSVVVFPEGTFTPRTGLRPFQLGAFKAALTTGRPICPVAIRGAREILRDETFLPRPGRVTLTFCPPLLPQPSARGAWEEMVRLRDAAREAIARHCGEPLL